MASFLRGIACEYEYRAYSSLQTGLTAQMTDVFHILDYNCVGESTTTMRTPRRVAPTVGISQCYQMIRQRFPTTHKYIKRKMFP